MPAPVVFLSYSHDSETHNERVRELADRLRSDGIDAWIDRYSTPPVEGWPRWMEAQLAKANFVLLICTEAYVRRFSPVAGEGSGVTWEAELIRSEIHAQGQNRRFIPILVEGSTPEHVPASLRVYPRYRYPAEYDALLRHMGGAPEVVAPQIGRPIRHVALPRAAPQSEGALDQERRGAIALDEEKTVRALAGTSQFRRNTSLGLEIMSALIGGIALWAGGALAVALLHDNGPVGDVLRAIMIAVSGVLFLYLAWWLRQRPPIKVTEACSRLKMSRLDAFRVLAGSSPNPWIVVRIALEGAEVGEQDLLDILLPIDAPLGSPSGVRSAGPGVLEIEKRVTRSALYYWLLRLSTILPVHLVGARLVSSRLLERQAPPP